MGDVQTSNVAIALPETIRVCSLVFASPAKHTIGMLYILK